MARVTSPDDPGEEFLPEDPEEEFKLMPDEVEDGVSKLMLDESASDDPEEDVPTGRRHDRSVQEGGVEQTDEGSIDGPGDDSLE
jgi:hypothetical protein